MEYDEVFDTSGQHCPVPVLKLTKYMRKMQVGNIVRVISDDVACESNIPIFIRKHKHTLVGFEREDNKYIFYIRKN